MAMTLAVWQPDRRRVAHFQALLAQLSISTSMSASAFFSSTAFGSNADSGDVEAHILLTHFHAPARKRHEAQSVPQPESRAIGSDELLHRRSAGSRWRHGFRNTSGYFDGSVLWLIVFG